MTNKTTAGTLGEASRLLFKSESQVIKNAKTLEDVINRVKHVKPHTRGRGEEHSLKKTKARSKKSPSHTHRNGGKTGGPSRSGNYRAKIRAWRTLVPGKKTDLQPDGKPVNKRRLLIFVGPGAKGEKEEVESEGGDDDLRVRACRNMGFLLR